MKNVKGFGVILIVGVLLFSGFTHSTLLDTTAPWPTLRGDQQRTGKSPLITVDVTTPQSVQWYRSLSEGEGQWSTFVAVDGNHIYTCGLVTPHTYEFFAFNQTGKEVWKYSYKTEYYNPGLCGNAIIGTGNQLYWNVPGEAMFSFDKNTGDVIWSDISINGILNVGSVLHNDLLYGFNYAPIQRNQTLHGLNSITGELVFNSTKKTPIGALMSMNDGDGTLYLSGDGFVSATSLDGDIYFRSTVDYADFSRVAINSTTKAAFSIASFVRTDFGTYVYGISFEGDILWSKKLSERTTIDGTSPGLNNGMVFGTAPNLVVAFNQDNGEEIWKADIPNDTSSVEFDVGSPVIDASGNVFVLASSSVSQQASVWGFDGIDGSLIYQSPSLSCSTLDVGSALAIVSEGSFAVVCRNTVAYISS